MAISEGRIIELPDNTHRGTSLHALIPIAEREYQGRGPRASEKVYWLADAMETPDFWNSLHEHLLFDDKVRQSIGGMFSGESGEKPIGPYDWKHTHYSLDNFMKKFGGRATEFLFRDFKPDTRDSFLANRINAARLVALDRYPRLRRLYWDDYRDVLATSTFWEGMIADLRGVKKQITSTAFFEKEATQRNRTDMTHLGTEMERVMMRRLVHQAGLLSERAQQVDYRSLSQIIRGLLRQNPRTFFLNYKPEQPNPALDDLIVQAKALIKEKIKPIREKRDSIIMISRHQLDRETRKPRFWKELSQDMANYSVANNLTYNLDSFIRFYDPDEQELINSRLGKYAYVATAFAPHIRKGPVQQALRDPSKDAAFYLMWDVKPTEEIRDDMLDAKRLAAELFPNDCLFVNLQLPEFWEKFREDLNLVSADITFSSFLRMFSPDNPTASRAKHKNGDGEYFRFFFRAHYKPEQVTRILQGLNVPISDDFKQNLRTLFITLAPSDLVPAIVDKFPKDFSSQRVKEREEDRAFLEKVKAFLRGLNVGDTTTLTFDTALEAERYWTKLQTASRVMRAPIITKITENGFTITRVEKKRWDKNEVMARDERVKELREQGLLVVQIAEILGIPDHLVESSVTRLVRKKEVQPRKPFGRT